MMLDRPEGSVIDSTHLLQFIEEGSVGAEIGVWKGVSSELFAQQNPSKLYLIDPWAMSGYELAKQSGQWNEKQFVDRYKNVANATTMEEFDDFYETVYQSVVDMFKDNEAVEIFRGTFEQWIDQVGAELDWVYVDGDHSEVGCYRDLTLALDVVKKGGVILGDDYGNKPGVVKAVNRFAKDNNLTVEKHGNIQFKIQL